MVKMGSFNFAEAGSVSVDMVAVFLPAALFLKYVIIVMKMGFGGTISPSRMLLSGTKVHRGGDTEVHSWSDLVGCVHFRLSS